MNVGEIIKNNLEIGDSFENPGGGTSIIKKITDECIYYKRGNCTMRLNFKAIDEVYDKFKGKVLYTNELKEFNPKIFDSQRGGHSCNCTMLFLLLQNYGFSTSKIKGKGVRGNPFYIEL